MHINILIEKNKKQCVWKCINLWLYARYQMKKKENHLKMNCCDMVYALSMEVYQVKVQAIKAYLRVYGMKHFSADDTLLFIETRMNEEHTLVGMLQTDLLNEQE